MYEVFNNDSLIIINEKDIIDLSVDERYYVCDFTELKNVVSRYFESGAEKDILLFGYESVDLFEDFKRQFVYLEAAGGIVTNSLNEVLCIKRLGCWDFPKGKIEEGETSEYAALREVEEETGVNNLTILRQLNPTFHIYNFKGSRVLKKTFWYEMKTDFSGILIPQFEEDIVLAQWHKKNNIAVLLENSYRSLQEGFKDFF
jgi:8-oxo-dGTP pyrophosphatase MutT (NUDIX family)